MKDKAIRFFSPQENTLTKNKSEAQPKITGYISASGKLVLPATTLQQLGIDPEATKFKIGTQQGKRKLKFLYLIPVSGEQSETFELVKSGRGYVIPLDLILKNGGVDFSANKYTFTLTTFDYEDGVTGYELELSTSDVVKVPYTGKPRGRKPTKQLQEVQE